LKKEEKNREGRKAYRQEERMKATKQYSAC
jgi:hypothetical protein